MATSAEDAGMARVSDMIAADGGGAGQSPSHVNDPAGPDVVPGITTFPGSPLVPLDSNVAGVPESPHELARTFDDVVANVRTAYVGKTTLAKALARSLELTFGRVQFTADLLPSDVTGAMVFDRDTGRVTFRPG